MIRLEFFSWLLNVFFHPHYCLSGGRWKFKKKKKLIWQFFFPFYLCVNKNSPTLRKRKLGWPDMLPNRQLWKQLKYLHPDYHPHILYWFSTRWPNASLRTWLTIVYTEVSEVAPRQLLAAKLWLTVGNVQSECLQGECMDLSRVSELNQMEQSLLHFLYTSIWEKAHRKWL